MRVSAVVLMVMNVLSQGLAQGPGAARSREINVARVTDMDFWCYLAHPGAYYVEHVDAQTYRLGLWEPGLHFILIPGSLRVFRIEVYKDGPEEFVGPVDVYLRPLKKGTVIFVFRHHEGEVKTLVAKLVAK